MLNLGCETETVAPLILAFFQDLWSATSIESSRRDLLNAMAERIGLSWSINKICHPHLIVTPKTGKKFVEEMFRFYGESCLGFLSFRYFPDEW